LDTVGNHCRSNPAIRWKVIMNGEMSALIQEAHQTAIEHGWWDNPKHILELICLMHCELSEAAEAYRNSEGDDRIVEELADVVIRIFDLCGSRGWNLEKAVRTKMEYNKTRPYRHGGKLA
jgi:NTP pyrophosphatase (non-canonical NTP hydrolase)